MKFKSGIFKHLIVLASPLCVIFSSSCTLNLSNNTAHNSPKPLDKNIKLLDKLPYKVGKTSQFEYNKAYKVRVEWIKDGDTFDFVELISNKPLTSRFSGVDTPEKTTKTKHGRVPTKGQQLKYAQKATEFTTKMLQLPGIEIYCVFQKTKNGRDRFSDHYGRYVTINYIKYQGKYINLNSSLVRLGYARVQYISLSKWSKYFTENSAWFYELEAAEEYAKQNKLGIWAPEANIDKIYPRTNYE